MELKELTFEKDDEGTSYPNTVTLTMSIEEALWIAHVAGRQRGTSPHNEIYSCLTGDVFNRYWEEGTNGARKRFRFEVPPIRYDQE